VGGDVDRYIDAVSGMYKGRYMAGYSQDLGVTAVLTITIITVGVMEVIFFSSKNLILIVILHKFNSQM
jgi:hypothetical protein